MQKLFEIEWEFVTISQDLPGICQLTECNHVDDEHYSANVQT